MPGQMPIGGGVDGPQYQDYQDVADFDQQMAAAQHKRAYLNLQKDTLVLDIAQYSGELKLYQSKAETPVLAPYIKMRTSGPLQLNTGDLEAIEQEFVALLEKLPPKIRIAFLKDMQLPPEKRSPELIGLEKTLLTQAQINLWADSVNEVEGEEGIEANEEIEQSAFPSEQVEEYIGESVQHLEEQINTILANPDLKISLSAFLSQIAKALGDAKKFLQFLSNKENELTQKMGQAALDTLSDISRDLAKLNHLQGGVDSQQTENPMQKALYQLMANLQNTSLSISMALADISGRLSEITANLHEKLMEHTQVTDRAFRALRETLVTGLEQLLLKEDKINEITLMELFATIVAHQFASSEEILRISALPAGEGAGQAQNVEQLQRDTRSVAVQMSMGSLHAANMMGRTVAGLVNREEHTEEQIELIASLMRLITLLTSILAGGRILANVSGEQGSALFSDIMKGSVNEAALQVQQLVDAMAQDSPVVQFIQDLRLHELPFEDGTIEQMLESRKEVLAEYGVDLDVLKQAAQSLADLSVDFTRVGDEATQNRKQIVPNINVVI